MGLSVSVEFWKRGAGMERISRWFTRKIQGTGKPTPRGRQGGEGCHLTDEQERLVRQIICDKRPDQESVE